MPGRVAVVAGSPTWRRGMASVLVEAGYEPSEYEALSAWIPGRGGVAVFVEVGDEESHAAVLDFSEEHGHIPVVAVLPEVTLATFARALRVGASAAVGINDEPERMLLALGSALAGHVVVPRAMAQTMATLVPEDENVSGWLNDEEAGWLRDMAAGMTVADLAERVGFSERAMFRNLKTLYRRLNVANRTEALLWASRHGILEG